MSDSFNGYHVWLGIPPREQPPNHYRLLGISIFETDPDVIDHAADRQMSHVRTFQAGRHGALSQQILNELAAARLCLLNNDKKTAYDEQLRASLSAAITTVPVGKAVPVTPSALPRAAPLGPTSAGDSSVLGGRSGILSPPGASSVISPGSSSVISPGNSSVVSTGTSSVIGPSSSSVLTPGTSGVTPVPSGRSGPIAPGKSGSQAPIKVAPVSPGKSGTIAPGKSGTINPGKSGVIAPGKSGVIPGGRPPVKPAMATPVPATEFEAVDDPEVLPLDMALADDGPLVAQSIQIRGRRRSFRQGANWQRPLFMGLSAAVLVTAFVLLYYFAKWLASPEFKELFDSAFNEAPPSATAPTNPADHAAPPPTLPAPDQQ